LRRETGTIECTKTKQLKVYVKKKNKGQNDPYFEIQKTKANKYYVVFMCENTKTNDRYFEI
jgi:hypothetical protein